MKTKKHKAPRCLHCNKPLLRKSERILDAKEKYKGNMICYRQKFNPVTNYWSYVLWDGVSYKLLWGKKFHGRFCASMWAIRRT